jgi:hypothetical protein
MALQGRLNMFATKLADYKFSYFKNIIFKNIRRKTKAKSNEQIFQKFRET